MNTAEKVAEHFHNDGSNLSDNEGVSLDEYCTDQGAAKEYANPVLDDETGNVLRVERVSAADADRAAVTRYVFPDRSAIVECAGVAWDLEGSEPFSWSGE